jgi:hypothetical protein
MNRLMRPPRRTGLAAVPVLIALSAVAMAAL